MKFSFLKVSMLLIFSLFITISCGTAKNLDLNLPKDISEKPNELYNGKTHNTQPSASDTTTQ